MGKRIKLRGKELYKLGYPKDGKTTGLAINAAIKHLKRMPKQEVLALLKEVLTEPNRFKDDQRFRELAYELAPELIVADKHDLREGGALAFETYGSDNIDELAKDQMHKAMKLPIALQGALMPDAHLGYGLPIGGVLAAKNAVIPYGVGMDIGCRMCLSIYEVNPAILKKDRQRLKEILFDNTRFGNKKVFDNPINSEIFEYDEFKEIDLVKKLKGKAMSQIGTSGSGNHFVEFGVVNISEKDEVLNIEPGSYLALLSHSGSRGMGAQIAMHYSQLARQLCELPKEVNHLAWLGLDTQEGIEYWKAMNLAGDYASACHDDIHRRIGKAIAEQPICVVENHHNFAWKEKLADGTEVIVHRKGATPAGKDVLGVIPGSMTHKGYIVKGKGNPLSINSAAHGAGRRFSRSRARQSFTHRQLKNLLKEKDVLLMGGGLDEAPMAYKNINTVMSQQQDLVETLGSFTPKIVRMDGA